MSILGACAADTVILFTVIVTLPLLNAVVIPLFLRSRIAVYCISIFTMLVIFLCSVSLYILQGGNWVNLLPQTLHFYSWLSLAAFHFDVGFLLDSLSIKLACIVGFIALMVNIYTVGYMFADSGYRRFYTYMSLFVFFMLLLVFADNFFLLFVGWEGVSLISYLLIGFWYQREEALYGGLKAFIVNRIGDIGLLLGVAAVFIFVGDLHYAVLFSHLIKLSPVEINLIAITLFVAVIAKSAQFPLHVWLPESMEGPTPISALIHAATMVTAGVFLLIRLAPLYQQAAVARDIILTIGSISALFIGALAIVQTNIKKILVYSTISQIGYMVVACGVLEFGAAFDYLAAHAIFKTLLFLSAGSVILALDGNEDIREMGGLWNKLPVTCITFAVAALAMCGMPFLLGLSIKTQIIATLNAGNSVVAYYAFWALTLTSFVTAFYIFRAVILVFIGTPKKQFQVVSQEKQIAIWLPFLLLLLALIIGGIVYTTNANYINSAEFWFTCVGIALAWLLFYFFPKLLGVLLPHIRWFYRILLSTYGLEYINKKFCVGGTFWLAAFLNNDVENTFIDRTFVLGSANMIARVAILLRKLQSGMLSNYILWLSCFIAVFILLK